ncbi:hypothetical protein AB0M28_38905 [Streptomyces sp. NPDC051940]|uniref:hypothetical protein n=1 Tax=Streptomyces sp. NPDC051940 TaxID=3155675 RepID=UPI00343AA0BE
MADITPLPRTAPTGDLDAHGTSPAPGAGGRVLAALLVAALVVFAAVTTLLAPWYVMASDPCPPDFHRGICDPDTQTLVATLPLVGGPLAAVGGILTTYVAGRGRPRPLGALAGIAVLAAIWVVNSNLAQIPA